MSYRNKTYIAFDGDHDMKYYDLMKAWNNNENIDFDFDNAHDLTQAHDWAMTDSIKRSLKLRIDNSKMMILLIGETTKRLTKFVEYEVETAMRQELPIICVNLDGSSRKDGYAPTWMEDYPVLYVPFNREIISYAMKRWPDSFFTHYIGHEKGSYYYEDTFFGRIELKDHL